MLKFKLIIAFALLIFLSESFSYHTNAVSPKESLKIGFASKFVPIVNIINQSEPFDNNASYTEIYDAMNKALNQIAALNYKWKCQTINKKNIISGITLSTIQCSGAWPEAIPKGYITQQSIKKIRTNIISISFENKNITIKPLITGKVTDGKICIQESNKNCIKPLLTYVSEHNQKGNSTKIIAAINGNFFMREKENYHYNCLWRQIGRDKVDYKKPISTSYIGNSLTLIDNKTYSNDCALFGSKNKIQLTRPDF
jgi:uncharacterized protein YeaC (DUF1315 family)